MQRQHYGENQKLPLPVPCWLLWRPISDKKTKIQLRLLDSVNQKNTTEDKSGYVFCDFDSDEGVAWTLIESFRSPIK